MGATGQKTAISWTGFSGTVISLTPAGYSGDMVEMPNLALDIGDCMPVEPGDLVSPGEITVVVEHDESYAPAIHVKRDVTITHRPVAPDTNGPTEVYADAFIKSYEPGEHATNTRREATIVLQTSDYPTRNAGS